MTTLNAVGAGGAASALGEAYANPTDHPTTDDATHSPTTGLSPKRDGGEAIPLFAGPHDLHPLAQKQQHQAYVAQGEHASGTQTKGCGKVPDAKTRVYDVARTSQSDIDALKNSCDPKEQRLGHTIENVKAAYGDLLPANPDDPKSPGAHIYVTLNAGNGGEPVVTLTGKGFNPNLPTRVHTHYHGDNATVGDPVGSKAGQNSRIRETLARDPQTVFVLPECQTATPTADGPKHNNSYVANWSNVKSQAETTDIALQAAGVIKKKVEQETVSLHSRGGEVIEKLMQHDKSGNSLRADRLELLDCLYGSPPYVAAWGRTENGKHVEKVIYVQGSNVASGYGNDKEIAKTFKGSYIRIDIKGQLNETKDPVVYDGKDAARHDHVKGEKNNHATRQYNTDPHYQTTGRYMAMWPLPLANG